MCRLSLVAVAGLLTAVASLVAEHSHSCSARLQSTGTEAVVHGLVAPQHVGLNLCLLHWQADS